MNFSISGFNSASFWTLLSWVAALVLHFTGAAPGTQQVVDAAAGLVTALHVGGTHLKNSGAVNVSTGKASPFNSQP